MSWSNVILTSRSILTTVRVLSGVAVSVATWTAIAGDCNCSSSCNSSSGSSFCIGGSMSACMARCEQSEKLGRDMDANRQSLDENAKRVIPAFKAARDKLWDTGPQSPQFNQVLNDYKDHRHERDQALLMEYGSVGLGALFEGSGSKFKALDDKYLVPQQARQAFHAYAQTVLRSMVNAGPTALGVRGGSGYARMDEAMGGSGSYSGYWKIADQAEMDMYGTRHNAAPSAHLGIGGQALDYDPARAAKCMPRTLKTHPKQWVNQSGGQTDPEFEKAFMACLRAKD